MTFEMMKFSYPSPMRIQTLTLEPGIQFRLLLLKNLKKVGIVDKISLVSWKQNTMPRITSRYAEMLQNH